MLKNLAITFFTALSLSAGGAFADSEVPETRMEYLERKLQENGGQLVVPMQNTSEILRLELEIDDINGVILSFVYPRGDNYRIYDYDRNGVADGQIGQAETRVSQFGEGHGLRGVYDEAIEDIVRYLVIEEVRKKHFGDDPVENEPDAADHIRILGPYDEA